MCTTWERKEGKRDGSNSLKKTDFSRLKNNQHWSSQNKDKYGLMTGLKFALSHKEERPVLPNR